MEFKLENRQVLNLELINDVQTGYDEISPFMSIISKMHEDSHKTGFQRKFDKNERIVINAIWEKTKAFTKQPDSKEDNKGTSGETSITKV